MQKLRKLGSILACTLVLVACGSDETPPVQKQNNATPVAATATPQTSMEIGDVVWATSTDPNTGEPTEIANGFAGNSPAIIASIEVSNLPQGTEFTAIWTINDAPIPDSEMKVIADSDVAQAWITFRFDRTEGETYPIGQLGVSITINNGTLRKATVEIGFP